MKKLLMCVPTHFQVTYDINPWMTTNIGLVDNVKATKQWDKLFDEITKYSIVNVIETVEECPDLVFTANAGFTQDNIAILSRFKSKERQKEEIIFHKWFLSKDYQVYKPKHTYEGAGDHLVDKLNRHWLGTGFRTDKQVKEELEQVLNVNINLLELVDPRWYHLDTCFCPLPNGEILWYPNAFTEESRKIIDRSFKFRIEISEEDALMFACNCVGIKDHLFLPKGTEVERSLRAIGYAVHEFELDEFIKAGGAAKCLVLNLSK